jgi:transposase
MSVGLRDGEAEVSQVRFASASTPALCPTPSTFFLPQGSPWRRAALVEVAQAAGRTKSTYVGHSAGACCLAIGSESQWSPCAVAHALLVMAYHVLIGHERGHVLGANHVDERDRQAVERRLVQRLQTLGYNVSL